LQITGADPKDSTGIDTKINNRLKSDTKDDVDDDNQHAVIEKRTNKESRTEDINRLPNDVHSKVSSGRYSIYH
jgi:hypothetical protein